MTLPEINGEANIGVAGAFSGFIGNNLFVAGGANFPDATPWNGGYKTWWNTLYYIDISNTEDKWNIIQDGIPKPLAYGNTIELPSGLLCIGGCDSSQCHSDIFLLQLKNGEINIDTDWPSLPIPLANATSVLLDNKIYIAGGQEKHERAGSNRPFLCSRLSQS
ncbi:MAG: hypothetical protein LUD46_19595 [Parabacteroides sp.]|nr:hypothetical protein [Parabacteroides sp.]